MKEAILRMAWCAGMVEEDMLWYSVVAIPYQTKLWAYELEFGYSHTGGLKVAGLFWPAQAPAFRRGKKMFVPLLILTLSGRNESDGYLQKSYHTIPVGRGKHLFASTSKDPVERIFYALETKRE